jgi:hypothetical protein
MAPPPLPSKARSNNSIVIVLCILLAVVVMGAAGVGGWMFVRKMKARSAALDDLKKSVAAEQSRMADDIKNGKTDDSESIARIKDQLGKSAAQLGDADAKAARGMASWLEKLQGFTKDYETAAKQLREAKVLKFDIHDRAGIEDDRKIVREFLDRNAKFADALQNSESHVRAELEAAGTPPATRDATLAGYTRSQDVIRPLQVKIRQCDQTLGENALGILDLLDQKWGKWERDEVTGKLRFQEQDTLEKFNGFIHKIQAAAAEQTQAQQELISKSRELMQQNSMGAH